MYPGSANANAFDRSTDFILQIFTIDQAKKIIQYHGDAALQPRIEELARKANEDELTHEEQEEYEGYVRANKFVAILQAKALRRLSAAA